MRLRKLTTLMMGITGSLSFVTQPALAVVSEMIVTAEKREASVQKTGITISAFNGEMLDKLGIQEIQNIANFVPGMIMGNESSDFKVMIRGVGADNLEAASDPGVALNIDGVYQARPSGFNAVIYDSKRIEVLRGPQGTLYGRNATGGVINLISNAPDATSFNAGIDVLAGDYDRWRARGFINVPIVEDKLAIRVTGVREKRDGYQDNLISGGTEGDDSDVQYGRAQVLFLPSDDISITLRAFRSDFGGVGQVRKRTATAPCTGGLLDADDCGFIPDPLNLRKVYKDTPESRDLETWGSSGELNLKIADFATLIFIAAYQEREFDLVSDSDQTLLVGPTPPGDLFGEPGGSTDIVGVTQNSDQTTFEVRLSSQSGSDLEWIVGGFYLDENAAQVTNIDRNPFVFTAPAKTIHVDHDVNSESWGIFGQASYHVLPNVKITGGVRYSKDKKSGIGGTTVIIDPLGDLAIPPLCVSGCLGTPPPVPASIAAPNPFMPSVSFDKITWRVAADWSVTEDNMLYASVSTGYKAGGFNFGSDALTQYAPEEVLAFEVGSKNRFRDDTVQLNGTVFYYDYSNQQIIQVIDQNLNVQNADSEVYGVELEGIIQVTDQLQFDGHIAYLHARIDKFMTEDQARPSLGNLDLSGNTLVNAPDWSGHIGVQYTYPVFNSMDVVMRVNTFFQDEVFLRVFNTELERQASFTKTDASLRLEANENKWFGEIVVENIENDDVLSNMEVTDSGIFLASLRAPRVWYIRFGVNL